MTREQWNRLEVGQVIRPVIECRNSDLYIITEIINYESVGSGPDYSCMCVHVGSQSPISRLDVGKVIIVWMASNWELAEEFSPGSSVGSVAPAF